MRPVILLALLVAAPSVAHATPRSYHVELTDVKIETDWGFSGRDPERFSEPIHALLRAVVLDGDKVMWTDARGGGLDDSNLRINIWGNPEYQGHGDSRFSVGSVPMTKYKYAQYDDPVFALDNVIVDPDAGQRLAVHLALGLHTWFHTIPHEDDLEDKIGTTVRDGIFDVAAALSAALGSTPIGLAVELFQALIHAFESHTAQTPCWGILRDDVFEVPLDQLGVAITMGGGWFSQPAGLVQRAEPQGYKCPELRVSYHLLVTADPVLIDVPPAQPCTLRPVVVDRVQGSTGTFGGITGSANWGDLGNALIDTVSATALKVPTIEQYVTLTREHAIGPQLLTVTNAAAIPQTERIYDPFLRNFWDRQVLRAGWVTPISAGCSYFTNITPDPLTVLDLDAYGYDSGEVPDPSNWPGQPAFVNATTLRLDERTSLHLYGEYQGNQLLAYRVRYLRRDDGGRPLTDVMLLPSAWPPN